MTQNWTKIITTKTRWLKNSKKITKDIINGYVYVEKNIIVLKIIYNM